MIKDVTLTFRMPRPVRDALEIASKTDLRPAGQYLLRLLVADLMKAGLLRQDQGRLALTRAPRSDRGKGRGRERADGKAPPPKRGRKR